MPGVNITTPATISLPVPDYVAGYLIMYKENHREVCHDRIIGQQVGQQSIIFWVKHYTGSYYNDSIGASSVSTTGMYYTYSTPGFNAVKADTKVDETGIIKNG